jgi:hypothetical protein
VGYNFEKVVARVSLLFQLDKDYITGRGRQKDRVKARDLVNFKTHRLGRWYSLAMLKK